MIDGGKPWLTKNPLTPQEYKNLDAPKHAIPMHYGTNPYLVGTPAEFIKAMGKTSTKIHDMKPGDKLEF